MSKRNMVFIAQSLDGYIADREGGLDWLQSVPNPDQVEMGYNAFIERIDAILMGRNTFEAVCSFGIDWPYTKPVFVMSTSLERIPEKYARNAELVNGSLEDILNKLHAKGFSKLYIDGGKTVQSFLKEDLIDELIITTIPILLGGGSSLFGELPNELMFSHVKTEVFLGQIVQSTYERLQ